MGCDYYICKCLEIKFHSLFSLTIDLERDNGYFNFYLDEDDPNYNTEYEEYVKKTLENCMNPIIIYENNQFNTKKLEEKYKFLIDEELKSYNKGHEHKKEWKDIIEIVKIEYRYERD